MLSHTHTPTLARLQTPSQIPLLTPRHSSHLCPLCTHIRHYSWRAHTLPAGIQAQTLCTTLACLPACRHTGKDTRARAHIHTVNTLCLPTSLCPSAFLLYEFNPTTTCAPHPLSAPALMPLLCLFWWSVPKARVERSGKESEDLVGILLLGNQSGFVTCLPTPRPSPTFYLGPWVRGREPYSPEGGDPIHCAEPSIFIFEGAPETGLPRSHYADTKTESQRGKQQ